MTRSQLFLGSILAIVALAFAGTALAKAHEHKNGEELLGSQIKVNGPHVIDKHGKYTATAQVSNGKITGVAVKHADKGDVAVKKVKTNKKMAQADVIHPVAYTLAQAQDLGTTYIGYSYIDDYGNEVVYWFPYEMILDGATGAIDYVPVA